MVRVISFKSQLEMDVQSLRNEAAVARALASALLDVILASGDTILAQAAHRVLLKAQALAGGE